MHTVDEFTGAGAVGKLGRTSDERRPSSVIVDCSASMMAQTKLWSRVLNKEQP